MYAHGTDNSVKADPPTVVGLRRNDRTVRQLEEVDSDTIGYSRNPGTTIP